MSNAKRLMLVLLGAVFLVVSTYLAQLYVARERGQSGHFAPGTDPSSALPFVLIVVVTLLGIVCHYLFEKLKTSPGETINLRAELSAMVSSRQFWMALFAAPLTFNATYVLIGDASANIGVGSYLLAFQNGFFWESIVDGLLSRNQETTSAEPDPGTGVAMEGSGSG
jgi:hypothetical protein